jgi:hypothetical protein
MRVDIVRRAYESFRPDTDAIPAMTLRGGAAVDGYDAPPPHDAQIDEPTDSYLETYAFWGLSYLAAASWRHYLPGLIDYALRHMRSDSPATMTVDGLLASLRPPDREPPRLGSLSPAQEALIVAFLDELAFGDGSRYQEQAMQVLEEWWVPNALYREPRT